MRWLWNVSSFAWRSTNSIYLRLSCLKLCWGTWTFSLISDRFCRPSGFLCFAFAWLCMVVWRKLDFIKVAVTRSSSAFNKSLVSFLPYNKILNVTARNHKLFCAKFEPWDEMHVFTTIWAFQIWRSLAFYMKLSLAHKTQGRGWSIPWLKVSRAIFGNWKGFSTWRKKYWRNYNT